MQCYNSIENVGVESQYIWCSVNCLYVYQIKLFVKICVCSVTSEISAQQLEI